MQIIEIIQYLENIAPLDYQESYDNAGLITGHPGWEVQNVLLSLDVTEAILTEAIEKKCNLIIAHHPIIFKGLKKITGKNYVERVIINAIKNDIAIYAAHTNLDNINKGVSHQMANKLGLINQQILFPQTNNLKKIQTYVPLLHADKVRQALFNAGAGHIGLYDHCSFNINGTGTFKPTTNAKPYVGEINQLRQESETKIELIFPAYIQNQVIAALLSAHPYEEPAYDILATNNINNQVGAGMIGDLEKEIEEEEFLYLVKNVFLTKCIRHTAFLGKKIKKVALCGGAGSFLLPKAISAGAQAYISADFKYHEFFDSDNQILITDIGHYESEQFTIELFYKVLTEKFHNFAPLKTSVITNPINYFV